MVEYVQFFDGQTEEPRLGALLARGYWRLVLVQGILEHVYGPYRSRIAAEQAKG